ncbi:addiction module toxin RelE [Citrobacter amalonaticus]|nr:addiction module toxin RelE [Citrobacter amalonaticus]
MARAALAVLRVIVVVQVKKVMPYTTSFSLYQGGKKTNPDELTLASDLGEKTQPAQIPVEG